MRILLVFFLVGLVGCSTEPSGLVVEYRYVVVPKEFIPPEPKLESVKSEELPKTCVKDSTYRKLVLNQRKLQDYSKQLRALLETNQN